MAVQSQGITVNLQDLITLRLQLPASSVSRKLNNPWVGDRHSKNRGRGMDFEGVRIYQPGDDMRAMDWKVTARTNKPQVKIFNEERERPVYIILDLCRSMYFGTRVAFKSVVASMLAALLSWRAFGHGDRVGGLVYNENEHRLSHPLPQKRGVLSFLKHVVEIANVKGEHSQDDILAQHLQQLRRILKPGSGVILISDFYSFSNNTKMQLQHLALRQQIESFFIYDPLEAKLPTLGFCEFASGDQRIKINTLNKKTNERYHEQFVQKLNTLRQWHYQYGMGFCPVATNDNLQHVLRSAQSSGRVN